MLRSLLPPPRRALSFWAVFPLLMFLGIFVAGIILCEHYAVVRFTWRPAFWLLAATPWIWWMHFAGGSGLTGWRAQAALFSRLILAGLFTVVLAEPRAVRKSDRLSVIYTLDVSDSM